MRPHTVLAAIAWGDAPTWLGVILAGLAGLAGFLIYRIESNRDERTTADARARDAEVRQQQAARVYGWYGSIIKEVDWPGDDPYVRRSMRQTLWGAYVRNASDLPIYDVRGGLLPLTPERHSFHRPRPGGGTCGTAR